jgi:hypothetical protein
VPGDAFQLSADEAAMMMQPAHTIPAPQRTMPGRGNPAIPPMPPAREIPAAAAMQFARQHLPAGVVHG